MIKKLGTWFIIIFAVFFVVLANFSKKEENENNQVINTQVTEKPQESDSEETIDFGGKELSKKQYKNKCKTISYKELRQYPDKYKEKYIKTTGIIESVDDGIIGHTIIIIDSEGNRYEIYISALNDDYEEYVEGNKLKVWGECDGNSNYETLLGKTVTVPRIDAKYDKLWVRS